MDGASAIDNKPATRRCYVHVRAQHQPVHESDGDAPIPSHVLEDAMTNFRFPPPPPPPPKNISVNSQSKAPSGHTYSKGWGTQGRRHGREVTARKYALSPTYDHGIGNECSNIGAGHERNADASPSCGSQLLDGCLPRGPLSSSSMSTGHTMQNRTSGRPDVHSNTVARLERPFRAKPTDLHTLMASSINATGPAHTPQSQPETSSMHHNRGLGVECNAVGSSQTCHAGQKRKRIEHHGAPHSQSRVQPQQPKPPRTKAAVPLPVPNYGFTLPLPTSKVAAIQLPKSARTDGKKSTKALGLVQQYPPDEDSEAEDESDDNIDVDEETRLKATLKGGGYTFEYDGQQFSLRTRNEIEAWIKDRKRHFPTRERNVAKAKEANENRTRELDFLRKFKSGPPRPKRTLGPAFSAAVDNKISEDSSNEKEPEKPPKQQHPTALPKKPRESMLPDTRKAAVVDLGIDYGSGNEAMEESSSVLSESSAVLSLSDFSDLESVSDLDPPEVHSSRRGPPITDTQTPAPSATATQTETNRGKICSTWKQDGQNPRVNPQGQGGRMSLYEALVEQEMVKVDEHTLAAIKHLGQHGFLG